jgi:hypothetical protein
MIDWNSELNEILGDPLFDNVKPPRKRQTSSDRLIAGFQEISDFYDKNRRLPDENGTPEEIRLWHMLKGILANMDKIERCRPFDELGILPQNESIVSEPMPEMKKELSEDEMLEQILNDPLLSDITNGDDLGLFDVPDYMKERIEARKEADYVGKRVPCQEFDQFAAGFKEIHDGLNSGKYKLIKFSEPSLKVGRYFVEQGIIGYLAAFENEGKNKHGLKDGRTRVIYENGSEADIKFRTITKNLAVDGYTIVDTSEMTTDEFVSEFIINDNDVKSGFIYVLRSKSTRPEIANIKDLYKIGFTATSVESRIANAKKEATYLYADVEVVATWEVYNIKSSSFEALIHKLFSCVQLQVLVDNKRPKEWFIVPFKIIEQAIVSIINGKPLMYDPQLKQLVYLNSSKHQHKGMKCLSVRQPWAYFICSGQKDVENRSWKLDKAPGRILIHAGAKFDMSCADFLVPGKDPKIGEYPMSAIVGYVDVVGFTQKSDSDWAGEGPGSEWKWLLKNAKMFKTPIPYKGKLGLFDVPEVDPDNLPETI